MANKSLKSITFILFLFSLLFSDNSVAVVPPEESDHPEVTPTEDLMREHGVLRRLLLVYEESIRHLQSGKRVPAGPILDSANIIRDFIENYHEKLEEDYIFPQFKTGPDAELVKDLKTQHERGRNLTKNIIRLVQRQDPTDPNRRSELIADMREFICMYRPHAAREDTAVFPALHQKMAQDDYDKMGDKFEDKEKELFGQNGFENIVERVSQIEQHLGIYDIKQFTPKD